MNHPRIHPSKMRNLPLWRSSNSICLHCLNIKMSVELEVYKSENKCKYSSQVHVQCFNGNNHTCIMEGPARVKQYDKYPKPDEDFLVAANCYHTQLKLTIKLWVVSHQKCISPCFQFVRFCTPLLYPKQHFIKSASECWLQSSCTIMHCPYVYVHILLQVRKYKHNWRIQLILHFECNW